MAPVPQNPLPPHFILTPQQQNLLVQALTSNQAGSNGTPGSGQAMAQSPHSLTESPRRTSGNPGDANVVNESPYLEYDYDFGADNSFDFDFNDSSAQLIGDLPGSASSDKDETKNSTPDHDSSDKRSHPDEDDDDEAEGGGKRRESEGKVAKKPGRKPLTNEPSSKRKAQNRAAQRAFRERKEKHLKDLETKVEELQKVSENANNENSTLRARIDTMTVELNEYKKRLSVMTNSARSTAGNGQNFHKLGHAGAHSLGDVNFQFEFPKFGRLPWLQSPAANPATQLPPYSTPSSSAPGNGPITQTDQQNERPSQLRKTSGNSNKYTPYDSNLDGNASRASLDSTSFSLNGANTGSPSSLSNSNGGTSSSCSTSPEPCTQSPPGSKPLDTLTTIGEEPQTLTSSGETAASDHLASFDFTGFDLLAQQNGGQFDPQLFGGYREPQDNILANPSFDDSFFNDAFDTDFTTPYNMGPVSSGPKKDIIAEIDARKEAEDTIAPSVDGKLLTCNNIWEKLQSCPRVTSGDIDLDGLCSDLQKKAKCSGTGAVVNEQDFKSVMSKYLGHSAPCASESKCS